MPVVRTPCSRRAFLRLAALGGTAVLAAACSSTPPTQPAGAPASASPSASAVAAASAAPSPAAQAAPASGTADHLRVGVGPLLAYAGIFLGQDRGHFRDLNLDLEYVQFPGGAADMAAPLTVNQLDIANADPSAAFLNSLARGIPLRFVADGNHTEQGHSAVAWVIRKDLVDSGAIKDLPDLKGKKLSGIIRGSAIDSEVSRTLAKAGLSVNDADVEYLGFPDSLAALAGGALDGAIEVEPLVTAAVQQNIGVRWKGMDELFGSQQGTVIMLSPDMASRRDVATRFVQGYLLGVRDYLDAFDRAIARDAVIAILINNTTVKDPALYGVMSLPAFDPNGAMLVQSMKDLQQWYVDNGFVQTPANLDQAVDTSYLESALSRIGRR
jgi:NitT/TauT family transport system substrate-binding protein